MLMNTLCFVLGVACGVLVLAYIAWILSLREKIREANAIKNEWDENLRKIDIELLKAEQQLNAALQESLKPLPPKKQAVPTDTVAASVKERLKKAIELTSKQGKIDLRKGPESVLQHNELELEKLVVLRTILADGFDPVITIRYNTGDQEMLLSNYIASIQKGLS